MNRTLLLALSLIGIVSVLQATENNLIQNGTFDGSGEPWLLFLDKETKKKSQKQYTLERAQVADNCLHFVIPQDKVDLANAIYQIVPHLLASQRYCLKFEAQSNGAAPLPNESEATHRLNIACAWIDKSVNPPRFTPSGLDQYVILEPDWKEYQFVFVFKGDPTEEQRIQFGTRGLYDFSIRNVSLTPLP